MTCQSCAHWQPKASGPMAKHGLALCGMGNRWTFFPPQHRCGSHKQAAEDVQAARVKWLAASSLQRPRNGG